MILVKLTGSSYVPGEYITLNAFESDGTESLVSIEVVADQTITDVITAASNLGFPITVDGYMFVYDDFESEKLTIETMMDVPVITTEVLGKRVPSKYLWGGAGLLLGKLLS